MNKRILYIVLALILLVGVYGYEHFLTESDRSAQVEKGRELKPDTKTFFLPTSTTGQVVHHEGYSLSYSEPHEQAEWVAYELKKAHLSYTQFERPYFEIDRAVKTGAASWRNYKNSGYDKGHLCPAGDRSYNKAAHDETFLTSNIAPQDHDFNAGIWNRLEQKTRYWARKYNGVFVITGGVLKGSMETIGNEGVSVPNHFYKVIMDANNGQMKMIAFLMPHQDSNAPLHTFVVSVDSLEAMTGIDFFPELDAATEKRLEAKSDYKEWSLN